MFELNADTAVAYFRDRGIVPKGTEATATPLGDVISNRVIQVTWDDDCLVAKQPLANFRIKYDRPITVQRVHNEVAAIRAWSDVIRDVNLPADVPDVRFEDQNNHIIALSCIPSAENWRAELLEEGRVDEDVVNTAGHLLGAVHDTTHGDASLADQFEMNRTEVHDICRMDVHHDTVAAEYPELADHVKATAESILKQRDTLVHGDFCPKNILVDRLDGTRLWVIDMEFAHWGAPAFDVAYMLNYLLLKAVALAGLRERLLASVTQFWEHYDRAFAASDEATVMAELPIRMLARVDGRSRVGWVDVAEAETVRRAARRIVAEANTVHEAVELVRETTGD